MFWKRLFTFLRLLVISLAVVVLVAPEWPEFQDERHKVDAILGQRHFDFVVWEASALAAKSEAFLTGNDDYLDSEQRKNLVLDYLDLLDQTRRLESQIRTIYADPEVKDPAEETRELQEQVDKMRPQLALIQPTAEAIVQDQVATVIAEEGFEIFGQAWPPVLMHMTPLPQILIVSPREEIRQIHNIPLKHGLTAATWEDIESAVLETVDRSALVVPIGGLGIYPAMIVETANINFLADVTAHEWAHHWLTLHPLGLNYASSPALRTINETVASIVGEEVGARVIERFYPEHVPPPEEKTPSASDPDATPVFDFDAEMAQTRVRVDDLLAEGRVEDAETYMEERRQFFWDNDYRLRKLNQAYFAFYGAYADRPGEQGDNPIGPALLAIRENNDSLRGFMDQVAPITSLEELQEITAGIDSTLAADAAPDQQGQ